MQLWEQYRNEFPVTEKLIYLNHAAVAPLSRRAATAMQNLAQDALEFGSLHYPEWLAAYEGIRTLTARMINAQPAEIAIVKNTSEGIAMVATGVRWKPGDVVVAFEEEFPANLFPWKRLEAAGVEVRWLSVFDDLDRIEAAVQGARLLAISFVQYLSGYRVSLEAIGALCSRAGCLFFVDAIQGMGAFPIDVRAAKIDALSADGHKWLLGPEGCGVLFVRREVQDEIEPVQIGWTNFADFAGYTSREMIFRPNAGRYESGTLNTIGCFGLRASMELILEIGVERIGPAVQSLAEQLGRGAEAIGFELSGRRGEDCGSGIISIRKPGLESQFVVRRLKDAGIIAAARQGWVRFAPHFYISPADIETTLRELAAL
ncbi:MAG: aminotransferase class V-fold PLP-dependent enzyme [Terriglobia bacterium]